MALAFGQRMFAQRLTSFAFAILISSVFSDIRKIGVPSGAPFFFLLSSEKRTPAGMRFVFPRSLFSYRNITEILLQFPIRDFRVSHTYDSIHDRPEFYILSTRFIEVYDNLVRLERAKAFGNVARVIVIQEQRITDNFL